MAKEIERKFLVNSHSYRELASNHHNITQGYLSTRIDATVRVRRCDDKAYVTIKGKSTGASRNEWEYPIPNKDAIEMLLLAEGHLIEKTRYIVDYCGHKWEIDEFHGVHDGLVIAEIELTDENETFPIPPFIGQEVTGNAKYYNSALAGI